MAGGLDNLSAEGFSQLSRTINEAKELIKQQEALLRQTLDMEQQIIKRRAAGLKEYNDEYSRLLNNIASEQASLSAEMYKINEAGKEAADNAEKAAKSVKQAQAGSGSSQTKDGGSRAAKQTASTEAVNKLGDADSANWEAQAEKHKSEKAAIISADELKAAMARREEERLKVRSELEKDAYNASLNLILEKEQASSDSDAARLARANAIKDVEISNILEVTKAEQKFYDLKNEMLAELAYANGVIDENGGISDSAKLAAAEAQVNRLRAIEDAQALHEIKKQMDAEREEAIYQKRLEHGGKLRAEDLAAIEQAMAEKYGSEEKLQERIKALQKEQFEEKKKQRKDEEAAERKKQKEEERAQERKQRAKSQYGSITALDAASFENYSVSERLEDLGKMRNNLMEEYIDQGADEKSAKIAANFKVLTDTLSSLSQELKKKIDEIAGMTGKIPA